jgi:Fe-S oxidoreductase
MALQDFMAQAERCSQCSYCKWVPFDRMKSWQFSKGCPSIGYNNFQSYSARGKYAVTLALLNGSLDCDERVKDIAFQCQTCGSCDVTCKVCRYNLEPLEMIRELRAHLVREGQTLPGHTALIDGLKTSGNMLSKERAARGKWAEGLNIKKAPEHKASVIFHAGCRFSCDESRQQAARAAVSLLTRAGLDVGILGASELCCGGRAYNMGYRDSFQRCAETNVAAWKKAGAKTVVTSCADCYYSFKRLYPRVPGFQFEVLHTVECLDKFLQAGDIKLTRSVPLKVTYHDPCYLGRQGEPYIPWDGKEKKIFNQAIVYEPRKPRYNGAWGIYDPPRNVIRSIPGIELVEMERIREGAWCCGAGAGIREAYPEFAGWTAAERLEEAKATGAEVLVSACGWCERSFLDSLGGNGGTFKVLDIAELVQQALGEEKRDGVF